MSEELAALTDRRPTFPLGFCQIFPFSSHHCCGLAASLHVLTARRRWCVLPRGSAHNRGPGLCTLPCCSSPATQADTRGLDRIAFLSGQETDARPGRAICTAQVCAGNSKCSLGGLAQPCFWSPWFQPSDLFPCSFKCLSPQLSA